MRRWIFALLLLANIGLFLWGVQYIEPERVTPAQTPQEIHPERMPLVAEVPPGKLAARPKPPPPPPPPPPPVTEGGPICHRLGPVVDGAHATALERTLGAQGLAFTKREEAAREVTVYRVYLPPLRSRAEAERWRRELTQLGFRDHALIQDEGLENAVSLGLFTIETNARNHLKRLADKGVKAELQALQQMRSVYWFELAPAGSTPAFVARLQAMLEGVAGAHVDEIPCPAPVLPELPTIQPADGR
jgi:hypothetical protein